MFRFSGFISLLISTAVLAGCTLAGDITPPPGSQLPVTQESTQPLAPGPVYPIIPPDLANGQKLYTQNCSQCHGEKGLGDGSQAAQLSIPAPTLGLAEFSRQYSPTQWYNIVTQGNMEKYMPAFPNLTDRQRWDVVAYAMSLSTSSQSISQGKALYESECANCHGISGEGNGPDSSKLTNQPVDFTDQAFMAQSSSIGLYQAITDGIVPDMPPYTSTLGDDDRWALVDYLRSLTFANQSYAANSYPTAVATAISQPVSASYPGSTEYPTPAITQTPVLSPTSDITTTSTFLGSVTVQLINGSGGDAPSDVPVTLYGFDNMQNTYSETLKIGENGAYTFTNLLIPEGRVFLAGTNFASGTYGSDIVTANAATPNLSLQITVYDSITDVSVLTTDRVHIFFDFTDPKNVKVVEVFIISNPTKQAVVSPSPDGTVVTFPLPKGFTNLQFQAGQLGDRYVQLSQGFADTMTVNPGVSQYQVVFAFQMPYDRVLDFIQPMYLPTNAVVVMVPDNGVKLSSTMLEVGDTRDYQGTTYRMYNGSSLIAGSSLDFTLSGYPKQAAASLFTSGTTQNLAIGLGVFGVALVLVGLWLYRRNQLRLALRRTAGAMDITAAYSASSASPEDEETLMDAIIALDDQYHAGNLPQDAYLERRALLKEKIRKLEQE